MKPYHLEGDWSLVEVSWLVLRQNYQLAFIPVVGLVVIPLFAQAALTTVLKSREFTLYDRFPPVPTLTFVLVILASFLYSLFSFAWIVGAVDDAVRYVGGRADIADTLLVAVGKLKTFLALLIFAALPIVAQVIVLTPFRDNSVLLVLIIVPALVILSCLAFLVMPAVMLEGRGALSAIRRSISLMRRVWLQWLISMFGIIMFYIAVGFLAGLAVTFVFRSLRVAQVIYVALQAAFATLIAIYSCALFRFATQDEHVEQVKG